FVSTDVGLEDTAESFGLPATADFMFALISTEELQELDQVMVKQLKNRYNDPTYHRRFVIGVDRAKMRLFDCEQSAQDELVDIGPVMDQTAVGERIASEKTEDFKY
ncbi:MAG: DNA primase, partial [Candidatus Neomarinimicrobiota bacterium]|nr:DNA primase [Candidatus Neomarinimicrobiota bacterium]